MTCGCGMETHYAGGSKALSAFVNDHIALPSDINWGNTSHVRTYVEFVVEKDGSLSNVQVILTNFPEINEFILSVFNSMTNWVAGEYSCETVRTYVRVPISLVIK
jgi:protein TonB